MLDLVRTLIAETSAAVLLIAHNLGVIRTMCDRVGVMYAGKIVEEGGAARVFERALALPFHTRLSDADLDRVAIALDKLVSSH